MCSVHSQSHFQMPPELDWEWEGEAVDKKCTQSLSKDIGQGSIYKPVLGKVWKIREQTEQYKDSPGNARCTHLFPRSCTLLSVLSQLGLLLLAQLNGLHDALCLQT